jgi:hypothetical protein
LDNKSNFPRHRKVPQLLGGPLSASLPTSLSATGPPHRWDLDKRYICDAINARQHCSGASLAAYHFLRHADKVSGEGQGKQDVEDRTESEDPRCGSAKRTRQPGLRMRSHRHHMQACGTHAQEAQLSPIRSPAVLRGSHVCGCSRGTWQRCVAFDSSIWSALCVQQ